MANWLKQSTSTTLMLGPFLDATDGVTPETGVTVTARLSKNGGAFVARNDGTAPSHDENGDYTVVLDATDTNTLGRLRIAVSDSTVHVPVWRDLLVLPANIFDSLVSGSDYIQTDTTQIEGTDASDQLRDKVWTQALTESYASDGTAITAAQAMYMIWSALSEFAISGTTITAKKLDGSTSAMTFTLDSATAPTSRTRAT